MLTWSPCLWSLERQVGVKSWGKSVFLHEHRVTCLSVCPPQVQLQLLTAIVKLFLKKPTETQELVQQVLSLATQVGDTWDSFPGLPIPQGTGNGLVM